MSERLTDEQVADLADPSLDEIWGCEDVNTLAREVQEYRALRPTCPTCDGKRRVATRSGLGDDPCPDCTDGKMPLDKWVALLLAQCVRQRALLDDLRACPCTVSSLTFTSATCYYSLGHRNRHQCDCVCVRPAGHDGPHQCSAEAVQP